MFPSVNTAPSHQRRATAGQVGGKSLRAMDDSNEE
jgi:hypothetical protein